MRPLIQYDFGESTVDALPPAYFAHPSNARRPPAKKRKRNHRIPKRQSAQAQKLPVQHWDDPGSGAVGMVYDEQDTLTAPPEPVRVARTVRTMASTDNLEEEDYGEDAMEGNVAGEEEEESRPLTYEEIWDDAALVDAWNAAEAEYEAYHGTSKAWKTDPIKRSPLWYNKPYTALNEPKAALPSLPQERDDGELESDTAPLDFHTYVPTHDPSLPIPSDTAAANPAMTANPFFVPPASTTLVSRDEAFNNALGAMYWCGYWTAVFQCQSRSGGSDNGVSAEAIGEPNGIDAEEDEDDLVPAQR